MVDDFNVVTECTEKAILYVSHETLEACLCVAGIWVGGLWEEGG